jgi:pyruvate dehydrogenase E2 component (dihydrolipoamide acetyltransferase)
MTAGLRVGGAQPIRSAVPRGTPARAVKDVFMPALSSTMTEGKVVQWLKNEGDPVAKGEAIVVVESDKADMDVESFEAGFLGSIVVEEGGTANVGSPIAFIAETEAEIAEAQAKAGSSAAAPAAPAEAKEVCLFLTSSDLGT